MYFLIVENVKICMHNHNQFHLTMYYSYYYFQLKEILYQVVYHLLSFLSPSSGLLVAISIYFYLHVENFYSFQDCHCDAYY